MRPWADIRIPDDRRVVAMMHDDEAAHVGMFHVILCESDEEARMLVWLATTAPEGSA